VADHACSGRKALPQERTLGIGLIGFAGALAIYFVLPRIGAIYDQAKASVGGDDAFAAAQSFQTIAVIPVALFFIFAAVWLMERGTNTK
jgi:hypothetical protein